LSGEPAKFSKAPEAELMRLKLKLWKTRDRKSRITGAAYLVLSGFFFVLAYITRYILFEVVSILALLLGVVFVLIGAEHYVKLDVANRAVVSSLSPLIGLVKYLEVEGRAIHIPPFSETRSGRIFLPKHDGGSLPALEEVRNDNSIAVSDKGAFLPSIGNGLVQLYQEELGDLTSFDFDFLSAWLPQVLTDGLRMAEKVEIIRKGDDIHVKMTNMVFMNVCQFQDTKILCKITGCPVCSSLAEAIAKNSGRIVHYLRCENDLLKRETNAFYRFGRPLEKLPG